MVVLALLFISCSKAQLETEPEPVPDTRIDLTPLGLPKNFFSFNDERPRTIIGYRFVVWLNPDEVVVGFNTSPNSRVAPDRKVEGSARLLVFGLNGELKTKRDITYLADGYGEIVAEGEATSGPRGTLLFRIQSVNLDHEGRNESKSGVLLLDANLRDIARIDRFLEQTTFVDHALVFQEGFTLSRSRAYDILNGSPPLRIKRWQQDWPVDARDRRFGEHGLAYMVCQQELKPNEYVSTGVVYAGAKQRCKMTVEGENQNTWEVSLKDGETAVIVGLLADGSVVAQISGNEKGNNAGQLVLWKKDKPTELLPWIPREDWGSVESATTDMSRYAAFATCDDRSDTGRWIVFDRTSPTPIVNRRFPKNARAALSPDGLHYATFELGELHIYSLPKLH
ncbi:MAG TPA: hypothetical protein VNO32_47775 [Candidatus Acidoferrum sp.]|nr:hypothetical protein [Candidatus Acidoferrum sp.]